MGRIAAAYGAILIILGIVGYVATGMESWTALIPMFFGVPIFLLGGVAIAKPRTRKHAMHAAAALALLGFLGTAPSLIKLPQVFTGAEDVRTAAVVVQSIMALLSAGFVALAVRSFIKARQAQRESRGEE